MKVEDRFLDDIRQNPNEDSVRLIYADWLTDRGDPRGEFIRVQCQLARLSADDPRSGSLTERQQELLDEHGQDWAAPLGPVQYALFSRGFIEQVGLGRKDVKRALHRVVAAPTVSRLRMLDLGNTNCGDKTIQALAGCAELAWLEELILVETKATGAATAALASSPHLKGLARLALSRNPLGDAGVANLGQAEWSGLRYLALEQTQCGDAGVSGLCQPPETTNVRELWLGFNRIGAEGARALVSAPTFRNLELLSLVSNEIGDAGARALARAGRLPGLASLELGGNQITDDGLIALAESGDLRGLRYLGLVENQFGDRGLRSLAGSSCLPQLRKLDLRYNYAATDTGKLAIANATAFPLLEELEMNGLSSGVAWALVRTASYPHLRALNVRESELDDDVLEALGARYPDLSD